MLLSATQTAQTLLLSSSLRLCVPYASSNTSHTPCTYMAQSIDIKAFVAVLQKYGVPGHMVGLTKQMCAGTWCQVKIFMRCTRETLSLLHSRGNPAVTVAPHPITFLVEGVGSSSFQSCGTHSSSICLFPSSQSVMTEPPPFSNSAIKSHHTQLATFPGLALQDCCPP